MCASRRQLWSAFRHAARQFSDTTTVAAGNGPSTSYDLVTGHGAALLRSTFLARASIISSLPRQRQITRALRRDTEAFARQWRDFKTVALGSGVGVTQSGQSLFTALLPPALLWLLMVLPASYRAYAFRLCGLSDVSAQLPNNHQQQQKSILNTTSSGADGDDAAAAPFLGVLRALLRHLGVSDLAHAVVDEVLLATRAAYLVLLFLPALLTAPLVSLMGGVGRERWLGLVQWTLEHAGPAFIKWGQWASTRPDLFPEDLCAHLERLQTSAPAHSPATSIAAVERAFRAPISELFDAFDARPVASGSIAQIHAATLSERGAALVGGGAEAGARVAIKVRHPGVSELMHRDFILMQRAAAACSRIPALRELRLEESIRQFGGPLKEQLDLSVEAAHLQRFNANFRSWGNVKFPLPLFPLVTPDVLVESFEEGDLITRYVRNPHRHNAMLAQTGVDVFLTMMLRDNFIHADLHPGNIIVKEADPPSPLAARVARWPWLPARIRSWLLDRSPRVVLLDTGMIVELSDCDQSALLGFFRALTQMNGRTLAAEILNMSVDGTCKDPAAFAAELDSLFRNMDREHLRRESQSVIRDLIERMRQHQVTLRPSVSTVVVTSMVLEGWSSKLDPDVRILDTMRDMLATDWGERIGRTHGVVPVVPTSSPACYPTLCSLWASLEQSIRSARGLVLVCRMRMRELVTAGNC
ncbi:hypothetical protein VOLCADRAFT_106245 [Volvox carteri f. nagariensis]|uniref:ABC1 atypical kinase-like domain-containing protein n=1 Tax=Volvox carteri f. nagariensis TaxID=3068 RepID=D8U635_VOLCA|nr:uncharacterized protein VOLCADRAFT_106245 [Volvox carteri f. nagariensis]EFJ44870.1 hypothetical protein VOLCADRAFT_106245 [Volvox carteri f. nagariensis]|eukprot:XP_002954153.1 hypothetical protein VOLCADRAFT_106245 [Volvox carteri f. nagariensis]